MAMLGFAQKRAFICILFGIPKRSCNGTIRNSELGEFWSCEERIAASLSAPEAFPSWLLAMFSYGHPEKKTPLPMPTTHSLPSGIQNPPSAIRNPHLFCEVHLCVWRPVKCENVKVFRFHTADLWRSFESQTSKLSGYRGLYIIMARNVSFYLLYGLSKNWKWKPLWGKPGYFMKVNILEKFQLFLGP